MSCIAKSSLSRGRMHATGVIRGLLVVLVWFMSWCVWRSSFVRLKFECGSFFTWLPQDRRAISEMLDKTWQRVSVCPSSIPKLAIVDNVAFWHSGMLELRPRLGAVSRLGVKQLHSTLHLL